MDIIKRSFSLAHADHMVSQGVPPVLARAWCARGVTTLVQAEASLESLVPYTALAQAERMACVLADAIEQKKRLLIIADYDADGATACAVGVRALRAFGANVGYLVPYRLEHGYGLTPGIVDLACSSERRPDYLITVDNGISSHAGIERARAHGVPVLVTDHHLPGLEHPHAEIIVNPNQHGCTFPSKALAGCGVMYYVMWALQDELVLRGVEFADADFEVSSLLPLVAVGTIADVVPLDRNNRILVAQGLQRLRTGRSFAGLDALARVSGRHPRELSTSDIAFGVGPRINAAGRLETMNVGVDCLICDDPARAEALAKALHDINDRRKEIEGEMVDQAVQQLLSDVRLERRSTVLHAPQWHQGVIGVVAGRIKEKIWRPTFVLANGKNGELKGSGRSIPGLHLRDALDLVDKRCPGVLLAFGGHSMAAGITVRADGLEAFSKAFEEVCLEKLSAQDLQQALETDGALSVDEMSLTTVAVLKAHVWGQAFPEPAFSDEFTVVEARSIGQGKHLRLVVEKEGQRFQAVKFRHTEGAPPARVRVVYKLDRNEFRGEESLQLLVEHLEAA